jgi:predicted nucleotidyltransferase
MTNISFNLSGQIDSCLINVLRVVKEEADSLGLPFFVVGATARDILLEHCHAKRSPRRTTDLDIGIEVGGWGEYHKLSEALIKRKFSPTDNPFKFRFNGMALDVVPFGAITDGDKIVRHPSDSAVVMNVLGFQEAYDYSTLIRMSDAPILDIRVATIPGIALLKLIAWDERYPDRSKDAVDLYFFMEKYADAGNEDRLFRDDLEVMKSEGFDLEQAGISILGRDMGLMASTEAGVAIRSILSKETGDQARYRLVEDISRSAFRLHEQAAVLLQKLEKLKQGFEEGLYRNSL